MDDDLKRRRAELDRRRAELDRHWRTHDRVLAAVLPCMVAIVVVCAAVVRILKYWRE